MPLLRRTRMAGFVVHSGRISKPGRDGPKHRRRPRWRHAFAWSAVPTPREVCPTGGPQPVAAAYPLVGQPWPGTMRAPYGSPLDQDYGSRVMGDKGMAALGARDGSRLVGDVPEADRSLVSWWRWLHHAVAWAAGQDFVPSRSPTQTNARLLHKEKALVVQVT